jgi:glycosyltransferase involved in cell wall biosynthesis
VNEHCSLPKNTKKKNISIIIPAYNSDSTINKVLSSIKWQKIECNYFKYIEVIIIDDNSINEVSKCIKIDDYPFKIQIIRLNNNHGLSHARQLGVTHASGDILFFLDSDVILSEYYLSDHLVRNIIINNAVFVSFKENVSKDDSKISDISIKNGLKLPKYSKDLRIHKTVNQNAIGSYTVNKELELNILEDTNYFKDFYGSRIFGVYDLSCMTTGHNFSIKRNLVLQSSPFSKKFKGWGMEDVYSGLKMISNGNYIIPILSSGVYHIDHPPRSGSDEKKKEEYTKNTEIINQMLDSIVG